MSMYIINFLEGKPVALETLPEQIVNHIIQHFSQEEILPPGDMDITPKNFLFRHFDYALHVKGDASGGVLKCIPRSPDVVVTKQRKGLRRTNSRGDAQTYAIPDPVKIFVIVGPNWQRRPVVWLVVYFSTETDVQKRQREVKAFLSEQFGGGSVEKSTATQRQSGPSIVRLS